MSEILTYNISTPCEGMLGFSKLHTPYIMLSRGLCVYRTTQNLSYILTDTIYSIQIILKLTLTKLLQVLQHRLMRSSVTSLWGFTP